MATFFWVGGTGTWDATSTTHWSSASGGPGGFGVPSATDAVTLDANSSNGTITVGTSINTTNTIQSISGANFPGTWDNTVNNTPITFTSATGFNCSGAGVKTIKFGSATYNMTNSAVLDMSNANTTVNAGACTLNFTSTGTFSAAQTFSPGTVGSAWSSAAIVYSGRSNGTGISINVSSFTCNSITIGGPGFVSFTLSGSGITVGSLSLQGLASSPLMVGGIAATAAVTTMNVTTSANIQYSVLRNMVFSSGIGAVNATNSWDNGNNNMNGGSISNPSFGGASGIIGS